MHVGTVAAAGFAAVAAGHVGGGGKDVEAGDGVDVGELAAVERLLVGGKDAFALGWSAASRLGWGSLRGRASSLGRMGTAVNLGSGRAPQLPGPLPDGGHIVVDRQV